MFTNLAHVPCPRQFASQSARAPPVPASPLFPSTIAPQTASPPQPETRFEILNQNFQLGEEGPEWSEYLFLDYLAISIASEFPVSRRGLRARLLLLPPLARAIHLGPLLAGRWIAALAQVTGFGAPERFDCVLDCGKHKKLDSKVILNEIVHAM